jgi:hypothetical protein
MPITCTRCARRPLAYAPTCDRHTPVGKPRTEDDPRVIRVTR